MITAQSAIARTRRDITLGSIVRWLMLAACVAALFGQSFLHDAGMTATTVLCLAGGGWLILSFQSMRGSRIAADSGILIASGQFDLAEEHLEEAIGSFSVFRSAKLLTLHHLAVLRHAQSRWQDAAALCRALLRQSKSKPFDRSSRLILTESLLQLGDLNGAGENLNRLIHQRLSLRETLQLLSLQLDYAVKVNDWPGLFAGVQTRVQLAELLPTPAAARAQAIMALAAQELNQPAWREWLSRRAELLVERSLLIAETPALARLWTN